MLSGAAHIDKRLENFGDKAAERFELLADQFTVSERTAVTVWRPPGVPSETDTPIG